MSQDFPRWRVSPEGNNPYWESPDSAKGMPTPEICLAICTRNRAEDLEAYALPAIAAQSHQAFEALIVDDGSTDETVQVLERWRPRIPNLRVFGMHAAGRRSLCAARNLAVQESRAPIIVFTDDDSRPSEDFLERVYAAFESDPTIGAVLGKTLDGDSQRIQSFGWMHGVNMAFRRSLLEIHPFDENLRYFGSPYYDEMDLGVRLERAGVRLHFDPSVLVRHYNRPAAWRRMQRIGSQVNAAYSDAKIYGRSTHFRSLLSGWFLIARFWRDQDAFMAHLAAKRHRLRPIALWQFLWAKDAILGGRPDLMFRLLYFCLLDIPLRSRRRAQFEGALSRGVTGVAPSAQLISSLVRQKPYSPQVSHSR